MNAILLVSGALAGFCSVGHLAIGGPRYLRPMMEASFDVVPKKVMQALFHYITVNFFASTLILLAAGAGVPRGVYLIPVVLFIGVHFVLYALVQLLVAFTSGIPKAPIKLFQWTLFVLTGAFALTGVL